MPSINAGEPFIDGQPVPYDRKYHAAYWRMQEAIYRPPNGVQIDVEIQDTGSENPGAARDWLSRARMFWDGPSP